MKKSLIFKAVAGALLLAGFSALCFGKLVDRTVAVVNGEQILLSEFEQISSPMLEQKKKENPDMSEADIREFKELVLSELVNNKLIVQEAKKRKIHVSKRQIEEQMDKIKDQFPNAQAFKDELKKQGLTEEGFKARIEEQLMAEEITFTEVKNKVSKTTPAEVDTLMANLKKKLNGEPVKNLSEQEEQGLDSLVKLIENYLSNLKAQDKYRGWIEVLKKRSKITINSIE